MVFARKQGNSVAPPNDKPKAKAAAGVKSAPLALSPGVQTGLAVGPYKIRVVQLRRAGRKWRLLRFGEILTPQGAINQGNIRDPQEVGQAIAELFGRYQISPAGVIASFSDLPMFIRHFTFRKLNRRELEKSVLYKAATELPIPMEDLVVDYAVVGRTEDRKDEIMVVAARRSQLEQFVKALDLGGVSTRVIDLEAYALLRSSRPPTVAPNGVCLMMYVGTDQTQLHFFEGEVLRFNRSLMWGWLSFAGKESGERDQVLADYVADIERSITFYRRQYGPQGELVVMMTGEGTPGSLAPEIESRLQLPVEVADSLQHLELDTGIDRVTVNELKSHYSVPIGLALRGR